VLGQQRTLERRCGAEPCTRGDGAAPVHPDLPGQVGVKHNRFASPMKITAPAQRPVRFIGCLCRVQAGIFQPTALEIFAVASLRNVFLATSERLTRLFESRSAWQNRHLPVPHPERRGNRRVARRDVELFALSEDRVLSRNLTAVCHTGLAHWRAKPRTRQFYVVRRASFGR